MPRCPPGSTRNAVTKKCVHKNTGKIVKSKHMAKAGLEHHDPQNELTILKSKGISTGMDTAVALAHSLEWMEAHGAKADALRERLIALAIVIMKATKLKTLKPNHIKYALEIELITERDRSNYVPTGHNHEYEQKHAAQSLDRVLGYYQSA